jgi:hypothetical protein
MRALHVILDESRGLIAVHQITCGMCRRIRGWSFLGAPAQLPAELLLALQAHVGLPATSPLSTVNAWRAALDAQATRR